MFFVFFYFMARGIHFRRDHDKERQSSVFREISRHRPKRLPRALFAHDSTVSVVSASPQINDQQPYKTCLSMCVCVCVCVCACACACACSSPGLQHKLAVGSWVSITFFSYATQFRVHSCRPRCRLL